TGSGNTGRGRCVGPRLTPAEGALVLVSPQGLSGFPGVEPLVFTVTSSNLPDDPERDRPDGHYGVTTERGKAARRSAARPKGREIAGGPGDAPRRTPLGACRP